jgi:hypothetical protein
MWMGGVPPLGYRVADRKLVVIDSEAEIVRLIFRGEGWLSDAFVLMVRQRTVL